MRYLALVLMSTALACSPSFLNARVAIRVNGDTLTKSQFERYVKLRQKRRAKEGRNSNQKKVRKAVVDEVVRNMVVQTRAREAGFSVSDTEAWHFFEQYRSRVPERVYRRFLQWADTSKAELLNSFQDGLLVQKYLRARTDPVSVSDTEARSFYKNNQERFAVPYEQSRKRVRRALKRRKAQNARYDLARKLREQSNIKVYVDLD